MTPAEIIAAAPRNRLKSLLVDVVAALLAFSYGLHLVAGGF